MLIAHRNGMAVGKPIPYDAEVDYIGVGATIGPYIDTGYRWTTDNIKIDIEFLLTNNSNALTGLFGSQKVGQDTNWGIQYWNISAGDVGHYIGNTTAFQWNPLISHKYHIVGETSASHDYSVAIDGVAHTGTWSGTVCQDVTTIGLFTLYNNSNMTARRTNNVNVYSFKLTDDGVLVRDMIPVRFKNENNQSEGAMYDRLGVGGMNPDGSPRTDGLYRNLGTGAFVFPTA